MSDKEVARHLQLSDLTVRKHRSHLLKKTDTANVCALIFLAATSGWIDVVAANPDAI
jgi:DNA-binding NarL/FixJ family response regulator